MRLGTPLDPGSLDQRVMIQFLTEPPTTPVTQSGFPTQDWTSTPSVTVMMARSVVAGRERVSADQVTARSETVFVMHYRADMDPDLVDVVRTRRLSFQSRIYNLTSAQQIGAKAAIELSAMAKVG